MFSVSIWSLVLTVVHHEVKKNIFESLSWSLNIPYRLLLLFLVAFCSILFTTAKDFNCKIKKVSIETKQKTFVTCELENVKYDGKDKFGLKWNKTALEIVAGFTPNEEYIDEERINDFVTQVKFKSSTMSTIPNEIFDKLPQVQVFDAIGVALQSVNALSFNKAGSLLMIFLNHNRLTIINDNVFVHSKNLETLDLSNNKISKITSLAFNSLTSLEELSLSNNHIASFDDGTFSSLTKIKWIWLDRNRITMIPSDFFTKANANLHGIHLDNNELNAISPFVFDNLSALRFLWLRGNNCVSMNFVNYVIPDNAGIKLELKECHQKYRKLMNAANDKNDEDNKYNVTQIYERLRIANNNCANESLSIESVLNLMKQQIAKLQIIFNAKERL